MITGDEPPETSLTMIALGKFFNRLDPMVEAGINFHVHEGGIVIQVYIPESQLKHIVRDDTF